MAEIILHHYPQSPFGEMARLALGLKGLSWKSVIVPNVSPKPDLTALTGGYERVPVLQIGADIYCDTACIIDALETARAIRASIPRRLNEAGRTIALWAGGPAFTAAVGAALGPMRPDAGGILGRPAAPLRHEAGQLRRDGAAPAVPVHRCRRPDRGHAGHGRRFHRRRAARPCRSRLLYAALVPAGARRQTQRTTAIRFPVGTSVSPPSATATARTGPPNRQSSMQPISNRCTIIG